MDWRIWALAVFWFLVGSGVGAYAFRIGSEPAPAAILFVFGAGGAWVGTVLTVMIPWGIRELYRYRKAQRERVTVLPPERQQPNL